MNDFKRLSAAQAVLVAGGIGFSLAALWLNDRPVPRQALSLSQIRNLPPQHGGEADLVGGAGRLLASQATLIDGRRSEILESLRRTADSAPLNAWAAAQADSKLSKHETSAKTNMDTNALLAALCRSQKKPWNAAVLAEPTGQLVAAWPVPIAQTAPPISLAKDPYFLALNDPSMGPGIVRHGYAKAFPAKGSQAKADLVAACGLADAKGAFGGLLKIRVNVRQMLFGTGASPYAAFLAGRAQSEILLVLGNGQEIYNSSRDPLTEDLGSLGAEDQALLQALVQGPAGNRDLAGLDGKPMVAVWQRVGIVAQGATPADILSVLV